MIEKKQLSANKQEKYVDRIDGKNMKRQRKEIRKKQNTKEYLMQKTR